MICGPEIMTLLSQERLESHKKRRTWVLRSWSHRFRGGSDIGNNKHVKEEAMETSKEYYQKERHWF